MIQKTKKISRWGVKEITFTIISVIFGAVLLLHLGVTTELDGTVTRHLSVYKQPEGAAGRVHWVDMPTTPFIEVGRRADGSLDFQKMIDAHRQAGMNFSDEFAFIDQMQPLAPVLMGVDDPHLERQIIKEAQNTVDKLHRQHPLVLERLTGLRAEVATPVWGDSKWNIISLVWINVYGKLSFPQASWRNQAIVDMGLARSSLEDTVRSTGLRALHIPLHTWADPPTLLGLAEGLDNANIQLQKQTGWKGGVLGLGGRVELTVGMPPSDAQASGITAMDQDNRLQITSISSSILHEWLHALDFTLAQTTLVAPAGELTLSTQRGVFRRTSNLKAYQSWVELHNQLNTVATEWISKRCYRAIKERSWYWMQSQEAVAYAFEAQMKLQLKNTNPTLTRNKQEGWDDDQLTIEEARLMKPSWARTFKQLGHLGLSDLPRGVPLHKELVAVVAEEE